ncbi:MAG: serine/threonine-protein kinase [Aeoliella sp.]
MSDLTGSQLNDYRVLRRLGKGAMAEVYLAEQQSLARQVALKVLSAELASQPEYVDRFQHEARSAAALVHANIVQVYEVGQSNGSHFIAQEYVAGQNLGEWMHRHGPIEPGRVLDILRQVAAALSKAHEQSIVHRDVKPENIMLARSGEVKVADFGLARVTSNGGANRTQAGVTMGTPLYMSPEQIEGKPVDSRSDIYSLGVTAYHMLAGEPPFEGDTPLAVAVQHINKQPPPLADRAPSAPADLVALVERMLSKRPEDRFENPVELIKALRRLAKRAAGDGWGEGPENWSLGDFAAISASEIEATRQLDGLLRDIRSATLPKTNHRRVVWMLVASLLVGALLTRAARGPFVLAGSQPKVLEFETPLEQLFHAKTMADTPDGWKAVWNEQRFGDVDPYTRHLAEQGLVRYYFRAGDYQPALSYLRVLADLPESQSSLKTFGLVGLAVAHAELGHETQSQQARGLLSTADVDDLSQTDAQLVQQYRRLEL